MTGCGRNGGERAKGPEAEGDWGRLEAAKASWSRKTRATSPAPTAFAARSPLAAPWSFVASRPTTFADFAVSPASTAFATPCSCGIRGSLVAAAPNRSRPSRFRGLRGPVVTCRFPVVRGLLRSRSFYGSSLATGRRRLVRWCGRGWRRRFRARRSCRRRRWRCPCRLPSHRR